MAPQEKTNRLIHEKSPYLLQHAHDPVDWYPWGPEAFQVAKELDKPIFLSIGYSSCHWCHVMARECFESEPIARLLNQAFVNIKVDREELPEVDALYMEFAQSLLTGAAGWPLNVLLTPDLEPFFAATYLPPHGAHGMIGIDELIQRISAMWSGEEREKLLEQASRIVALFTENAKTRGQTLPDKGEIEKAEQLFFKVADPVYGGIKGLPKFPLGYQASMLLRCSRSLQEGRSLFLVERTLDMMHRGGIYDHLGGGFSRYSIDERWFVPHFEKMLYDNAILAFSYLEAYLMTHNLEYRQVCQETLEYVLRELKHPQGGFFAAEDADVQDKEGVFYTWKQDEIFDILGPEEGELFCRVYGVAPEGNFEDRNILHMSSSLAEVASQSFLELNQFQPLIERLRRRLFEAREKRPRPQKDDQILSSWNGLMIHALAEAGCALEEESYLKAACAAAEFLKENLWLEGKLLRRWCEGESRFSAGLDEHAFLIKGLLSLFEAHQGSQWLEWALVLAETLFHTFKSEGGAFYQTDGSDETIILRKCHFADGAEPSGNAVHCENLLRLYALTSDRHYLSQAEDILKAVKTHVENYPLGYCYQLLAMQRYFDARAPLLVVALNKERHLERELRTAIYSQFIPHKTVLWTHPEDSLLFRLLPLAKEQMPRDGHTTLYVCFHGVCQEPLTDFKAMEAVLAKL